MNMKRNFLKAAAAGAGAAFLSPLLSGCGGGDEEPTDAETYARRGPSSRGASTTLTEQEIADMRFMREEEKLAHDVYITLFNVWGAPVFANIAESETAHTEAVLRLLLKRGLPDPAKGQPVGSFENQELQALYNQLVEQGRRSLVDALRVGALIEEKDIWDIRQKMEATDEADALKTYQNLLCGSHNHLLAFNRQLKANGVSYSAQVLPQAEWDAIVAGTSSCTG